MLDHLRLTVRDVREAYRLYDPLMRCLGCTEDHIAFAAESRAVVDQAHEIARAAGAEILDPPQEFDYEPGYYATCFRDPSEFKLEVVARRHARKISARTALR